MNHSLIIKKEYLKRNLFILKYVIGILFSIIFISTAIGKIETGKSLQKIDIITKESKTKMLNEINEKVDTLNSGDDKLKWKGVDIALGTASVSGVFYPVGKGISRMINEGSSIHKIRCFAYSTSGSVYNIKAIQRKELDIAITREDLVYEAHKGEGRFKDYGYDNELRLITPLYGMPVAVIVKKNLYVPDFYSLTGKRINIGNPGSGKRTVSDLIFNALDWTYKDFDRVSGLSTKEMGNAFCRGSVDILIELLGIPAAFYHRITNECSGKFVEIPTVVIHKIKRNNPFIKNAIIPGGQYPNNPKEVNSFQIQAILITSKRVKTEIVYQITKSIFGNINEFKKLHPALWGFNHKNLTNSDQPIPFHKGALQYFNEIKH